LGPILEIINSGMKVKISSKSLAEAMNRVCKVVKAKARDDILSGILLRLKDGKLKFVASDDVNTIEVVVPTLDYDGAKDGDTLANAAILRDVSRSFKAAGEIYISGESAGAVVEASASVYVEAAGRSSEFPALAAVEGPKSFAMEWDEFVRVVATIGYSAKKDRHPKYAFNSAEVSINDGAISVTCTDSNRLANATGKAVIDTHADFPLVPVKALKASVHFCKPDNPPKTRKVKKPLKKDPGIEHLAYHLRDYFMERMLKRVTDVSIRTDGEKITIDCPQGKITCNKAGGLFPSWRSVLPDESSMVRFMFDRDKMLVALKQVTATQGRRNSALIFEVGDGMVTLSRQVGVDTASIPVIGSVEGRAKTTLNRHFLTDMLDVVTSTTVSMCVADTGPCTFRGAGGDYHLIVPMTVGGSQD